MAKVTENIKSFYNGLTPQKQRLTIVATLTVMIAIVGYAGYLSRSKPPVNRSLTEQAKTKDISLDSNLLAKTQLAESERARKDQDEKLKLIQTDVDNMKKQRVNPPIPGTGERSAHNLQINPATGGSPMMEHQVYSGPVGSFGMPMQPQPSNTALNRFPPVPVPPPAQNSRSGFGGRNNGMQGNAAFTRQKCPAADDYWRPPAGQRSGRQKIGGATCRRPPISYCLRSDVSRQFGAAVLARATSIRRPGRPGPACRVQGPRRR